LIACCRGGGSLLSACCYDGTTTGLRWGYDGASKEFGGFSLSSSNLCCPPAHRAISRYCLLHSSLYPYRRRRAQKVSAILQRRYRRQPPTSWEFNPLPSQAQTCRMNPRTHEVPV
jgi:hypothetical protein